MLGTLCESADAEAFKYPIMLQVVAFPKRRRCACLPCTLVSTLQGQTLTEVPSEGVGEGTLGSTCPGMLKLLNARLGCERRVKDAVKCSLHSVSGP